IDISICIPTYLSPDTVGTGSLDAHAHRAPDPCRGPGYIDDDVLRGAARDLGLPAAAGGVDEHVDVCADQRGIQLGLNRALCRLQRNDSTRLLLLGNIVRKTFVGERIRTLLVL